MTNGRLQHIKELVRLGACDPHLDKTKLNDLLPLTIDVVLVEISFYEYNTELGMFKYNITPILDKCVHVYKPFQDFFSCRGLMLGS